MLTTLATALWLLQAAPGVALDPGGATRLATAAARYEAARWAELPLAPAAVTPAALAVRLAAEAPLMGAGDFALRAFQSSRGLRPTGKLDRATLMALRRSPQELARVLRVNAARYAGLPTDSPPYVVVNVPSFELVLVTAAGESRRKIVAGCAAAPTPLLRDRLTAVQLNPPWRIPERIAYQEIIPQLAGDPDYLGKHGIRVLQRGREVTAPVDWAAAATAPGTYQLEQTAGTENPLGRLKFLTASGGDVLVHDTPGAAQFAADRRALSHGCIRVEDALGLAAALLGHADGGRHLAGLVAAGRPRRLALPASVPVQTLYLTAWVDAEGRPAFRRDEYGCDTAPDPLACPAAPPAFSP